MKGFKLFWGIWNFDHSITSRDTGISEIYATMNELNEVINEKKKNYYSIGYELWFTRTEEVKIEECICGKMKKINSRCWYCGTTEKGD